MRGTYRIQRNEVSAWAIYVILMIEERSANKSKGKEIQVGGRRRNWKGKGVMGSKNYSCREC